MVLYSSRFPKIDDALKDAQMSRKELSEKANINHYSLNNKLKGKTEFSSPEMYRIHNVLKTALGHNISFYELFTPVGNLEKESA